MKIESITLKGFRCFGPDGTTVALQQHLTALVGGNGAGKTALLQALSRLFGVTPTQRRIVPLDFHLRPDQSELPSGAQLSIDVRFSFPELQAVEAANYGDAVPEFYLQMAASAPNAPLQVRMMLRATWVDDGTPSGSIEEDLRYVKALDDNYDWDEDCQKVPAVERGTIQLVYVPATRNVQEQVTSLLKGRLWQAARWSEAFKNSTVERSEQIQQAFAKEDPARFVLERLDARWKQVHEADTDATPMLRLVESRFEEFIRDADFALFPDEAGQERALTDLSDGQRSLFHIALTAATLEVERDAFQLPQDQCAFDQEKLRRAHLTVLAIEEPENSLSPFFLAGIIEQARDIAALATAQVLLSSHSAAILSRIDPMEVRYFRRDRATRQSSVRTITLPSDDAEARKYVRLAVRAYPELYFARFVILAEGDSEQLVIPRVADALGVSLDRSFVPIVPLGGRYAAHFWRLLADLQIPHATLLDADFGRKHGGAKLVRSLVEKLGEVGVSLDATLPALLSDIDPANVDTLEDIDLWVSYEDNHWTQAFEELGVFFSDPLDLDFSMLEAFPDAYKHSEAGGTGPGETTEAIDSAKLATLKSGGDATLYSDDYDDAFRWYPYLFLRRSKPETHLTALARLTDKELADDAPPPLQSLIAYVQRKLDVGNGAQ